MKKLSAALSALILTACAGPLGSPYSSRLVGAPQHGAQIIVYYPDPASSLASGARVRIGDGKTCLVPKAAFAMLPAEPGQVSVYADNDSINFNAQPGHTYYVKIALNEAKVHAAAIGGVVGLFAYNAANNGSASAADWFIKKVDSSQAKGELAGTHRACE